MCNRWDLVPVVSNVSVLGDRNVVVCNDAPTTHHSDVAPASHVCVQEYFNKILKKLKEVGATSDRTNFYV